MLFQSKDRLEGYQELPELSARYQRERDWKTAPIHVPTLLFGVAGAPLAFIIRDPIHFLIYLLLYIPPIVLLICWANRREESIKVHCSRCGGEMAEDFTREATRFACHGCKTYVTGCDTD